MGLSAFYGKPTPDAERFAVLDRAYELGELNWDSADVYMDNEDLIGNWFKQNPGRREKIFLATKFGNVFNEDGTREIRNEPEYVKEACAKSLKRLGIECIDLYYCHRLDGKTPIEKMVQAMAELKKYVPYPTSPLHYPSHKTIHHTVSQADALPCGSTEKAKSNTSASPKSPPPLCAAPTPSTPSPPSKSSSPLSPWTSRTRKSTS